jgi:hypothetical protein
VTDKFAMHAGAIGLGKMKYEEAEEYFERRSGQRVENETELENIPLAIS